jgi:hypothetical protein
LANRSGSWITSGKSCALLSPRSGRPLTLGYDCINKSGKTTLNGALTLGWGFTQEAPNEILILANDLEQTLARVYRTMEGIIKHNPELQREAEVQSKSIYLANGTILTAISGDYQGAAGSNHGFVSYDELWGYVSEASVRLWEELTPVPTRKNSIRFISTYAGYENESQFYGICISRHHEQTRKGGNENESIRVSYRARASQGAENRRHRGRGIDEPGRQGSGRAMAEGKAKEGKTMRLRRKRGDGSVYLRGRIWWVKYPVNGESVCESSGSAKRPTHGSYSSADWARSSPGDFTGRNPTG